MFNQITERIKSLVTPGVSEEEVTSRIAELKKNPSFCANPFVHISSTPRGTIRPCCFFYDPIKKEDGKIFNMGEDSLEKVWNGQSFKEIRKKMLAGEKIPACVQCYNEEKAHGGSMRTRSFDEWLSDDRFDVKKDVVTAEKNDFKVSSSPRYLELKPGNVCNLKCRMCHKYDSNQIEKELDELSEKYQSPEIRDNSSYLMYDHMDEEAKQLSNIDWMRNEVLWENVVQFLPAIEKLSFAGGEPSLLPGVQKFLKDTVQRGRSKDITVYLASNFMKVNQNLLDVSTRFRMFEFIASIDGIGAIQEYIRHPSDWSVVEENFLKVKERMSPESTKILVNSTIQLNNILHFTDLLRWLEAIDEKPPHFFHHPFNLNILQFPKHLSIGILPKRGREIAIGRIEDYRRASRFLAKFPELDERLVQVKTMLEEPVLKDHIRQLKIFWHFTHIIDEHRGESLKTVDPLLYEIIKEELLSENINLEEIKRREVIRKEAFVREKWR
jgi:MoaA/NifB/PqqE/SkfB family radical SAM enzyme